ncbi:MAG TPA: BTAD domain-containing putative transcriptional regulator [Gemmatimonadaceae bacterium]|nr:BTAD domain-containing putative transcriptional regulator [Gemmatimonadaceae bacterium]
MTLRLHTFGRVHLTRNGEVLSGAAGQRRLLAILSILAAAGERGVTRDKLLSLLWADGDPEKSRHALTQSLYHIRKVLGVDRLFLGTADVRLDFNEITADVLDFQHATNQNRSDVAVGLYEGPFLDGFYVNGDAEFEFWVSTQRTKFAQQYGDALESLARQASERGDRPAEVTWRLRLADHNPLNGLAVAAAMNCLATTGDRAAALQLARTHEERMRKELDLPPDVGVAELTGDLRRGTPSSPPPAIPETRLSPSILEPRTRSAKLKRVLGFGPQPPEPPPTRLTRNPQLWMGMATAIAVVSLLSDLRASDSAAAMGASTRRPTIAVAPFRVQSSDASASYLREGLLDLLTSRIASAEMKRAADQATVLQAARSMGFPSDTGAPLPAALRLAKSLNAEEIVVGSIEPSEGGMKITASLIDANHGRVRSSVTVRGQPDSLTTVVDRIIAGLILSESDPDAGAIEPPSVSPAALRVYLMGRSAYRQGDYDAAVRNFNQSLIEEPRFALAALGLSLAADKLNAADQRDRGLSIAWSRQNELPTTDRTYLQALGGPRYPSPSSASEALTAWEKVVQLAPDRPDAWHELGERFYYDGEVLGMRDALPQAAAAFRQALGLDPSFAPSRRMLALVLSRQHDTTGLRRLVGAGEEPRASDATGVFVRWRTAREFNDRATLDDVRARLESSPSAALRAIAMTGQVDGIGLADGDRAIEILRRRAASGADQIDAALARHSRALNRGDTTTALAVTNEIGTIEPGTHPQFRLRVLDALYGGGNRAAATRAVVELESLGGARLTGMSADNAVHAADLCVLGQWKLNMRDTTGARAAVRALRAAGTQAFPIPIGANPAVCAELIDASLTTMGNHNAGVVRLAHLDSLMLSGPALGDLMRYANLVIARGYKTLGDNSRALAALQRRSYMRGWPRYRAAGLSMQVDLASALADSSAMRDARTRLAALRQ